jgi:hypothetical protein
MARASKACVKNMVLSSYHQKYADRSNEYIKKRADAKAQELACIFQVVFTEK